MNMQNEIISTVIHEFKSGSVCVYVCGTYVYTYVYICSYVSLAPPGRPLYTNKDQHTRSNPRVWQCETIIIYYELAICDRIFKKNS